MRIKRHNYIDPRRVINKGRIALPEGTRVNVTAGHLASGGPLYVNTYTGYCSRKINGVACGKEFKTATPNREYCDDCRKLATLDDVEYCRDGNIERREFAEDELKQVKR